MDKAEGNGACEKCGKKETNLKRCAKCKSIKYCSRACQLAHWPSHKLSCTSPSPSSPSPSSPSHKVDVVERLLASGGHFSPAPPSHFTSPSPSENDNMKNNINDNNNNDNDSGFEDGKEREKNKGGREEIREENTRGLSGLSGWRVEGKRGGRIMIMLHGAGDRMEKYAELGRQLSLPQCETIALQGPLPLPFDCGFAWFPLFQPDGHLITPSLSNPRRFNGLVETRSKLVLIVESLVKFHRYSPLDIFFFGFSQGAVVCVDFLLNFFAHSNLAMTSSFGGCVCIGDSLLDEYLLLLSDRISPFDHSLIDHPMCPHILKTDRSIDELTPIFLSAGTKDERNSISQSRRKHQVIKDIYSRYGREDQIRYREFEKGHEMINSKEEAKAMHSFLSERFALHPPVLSSLSSSPGDLFLFHPSSSV